MGMPISVEVIDSSATPEHIEEVYSYFNYIDEKFSTYKDSSEISRFNRDEIKQNDLSDDMKTILDLSEVTKNETDGYFNIQRADGSYDPSGLVKGWAIYNAAKLLEHEGIKNFYVDAGGDIQTKGKNAQGNTWSVGIRDPFNVKEKKIVKTVYLKDKGIATSGTYIRGQHIYNPKDRNKIISEIVSLSVIGTNVYEADRFATAAFAMGKRGIEFLEELPGFEAYMIGSNGIATMTSGFEKYTQNDNA